METDQKAENGGFILLSTEVELYVQALKPFPLVEISSIR
jgi:hypothetical protein